MRNVLTVAKNTAQRFEDKANALLITGGIVAANSFGEVFATGTNSAIVTQTESAAKKIYQDAIIIATPVAAAAVVVALVMSMFGRDQKKIDASRQIAKGVIVTWVVILGLGYILTYGKDLLGNNGSVDFTKF